MSIAVASRWAGALESARDHWLFTPLESRREQKSRDRAEANASGDRATARVLLIDDGQDLISDQLRNAFPSPTYRVQVARAGNIGLEHVRCQSPDVIILAVDMSDTSGMDVYQEIRRISARIPVIFVTRSIRADSAIEAIKQGAYDYLFQPLDLQQLRRVVVEALEVSQRMREPAVMAEIALDSEVEGAIIGACPAMREVYKAIGRVAAQDVPVLITGESGTGKDLVARAVYQHGARAKAPFLALNCAAIPENLLESELFGHEKGAFTGADRRRIGKFEQCHGGTIFLDEIGDMPMALQAKILRLMQDQAFERVGGNETIRTDVRLIAATHRDLKTWSEAGKFRPDLYYRLGVFTIHMPPLRERGEDLPMLIQHYMRRYSQELGRDVREVAPDTLDRLRRSDWPGNVRELQSVLKQALLRASGQVLLPAFLPDQSGQSGMSSQSAPVPPAPHKLDLDDFIRGHLGPESQDLSAETHAHVDRILLKHVLEHTNGNQHKAARLLGIARQTLRSKLRDLGLQVTHAIEAEGT